MLYNEHLLTVEQWQVLFLIIEQWRVLFLIIEQWRGAVPNNSLRRNMKKGAKVNAIYSSKIS